MIAQLSQLSQTAQPTAFHHLLRALDDRGRLLRVYTQNIDALELKSGLTFGVPELESRRSKPRSVKGNPDQPEGPVPSSSSSSVPRLPTPPAETPRCIPLHGTLQSMHCQICLHSFPLENYLDDLNAGSFPICPQCDQIEETRQAVGKRSRGVGKLRPSVVLYNEMHKDGEEVGEVVARDLVGNSKGKGRAGADLLLVVGTSLRVPGTKRMVREFSKAVHSRSAPPQNEAPAASSSTSPLASPRRTPVADEDIPIKTIYLNLDFPVPTREWEGVFDVWIRGDAQSFARMVQEEIEREDKAKEAAVERKRKREVMKEEAARAEEEKQREESQTSAKSKGKKGKAQSRVPVAHARKRKDSSSLPTPPRSVKRRKIHSDVQTSPSKPAHKTKQRASHPTAQDHSHEKLTIRLPPRPKAHPSYTPPTPPHSQRGRSFPEVVITTRPPKPRAASPGPNDMDTDSLPSPSSPSLYFADSSPLSTPPSTPGRPSSPLTPDSSSALSSALTSLLSSPLSSPPASPLHTPVHTPPSSNPAQRQYFVHTYDAQAAPNSGDDETEDEDDEIVDIEGDGDHDGVAMMASSFPVSFERGGTRTQDSGARTVAWQY